MKKNPQNEDGIVSDNKLNEEMPEGKNNQKSRKKPMTIGEKVMILIFIAALASLIIKSVYLDEVKDLTSDEQKFKDFVEYSVEEEYSGFLADAGLMCYRVYDIKMEDPKQIGVLRYEDPKTGKMVEVKQNGRYTGSVRGYIFWILPIKQFAITSQIQE